jgi:hypothetical protein
LQIYLFVWSTTSPSFLYGAIYDLAEDLQSSRDHRQSKSECCDRESISK